MVLFRGRGRNWKILAGICTAYGLIFLYFSLRSPNPDVNILSDILNYKCPPKTNVVYIKMIKCASTTLASVFQRFGYVRNLSFVLPRQKRIYLGWPYQMKPGYYRPSKTGTFNILCEHAVFNYDTMSSMMPEDTIYVTSIREPYSQFKSMFNYYKLQINAQVPGYEHDAISEYLTHLNHYEALYKSHNSSKTRYCIPDGFSMSKNLMSFNLGFANGFPEDAPDFSHVVSEINYFFHELSKRLDLVMIVEYFDESLILFKRLMCWSFKDILYHRGNIGKYNYKEENDPELVSIYRNWSHVDYILYEQFKSLLIKKIEEGGSDLQREVAHFRSVMQEVTKFCDSFKVMQNIQDTHTVAASKWNDEFSVDTQFCELLSKEDWLEVLKSEYDKIPILYDDAEPDIYFC